MSIKFQGDMLNFCDFIQVYVFTTNHHLNETYIGSSVVDLDGRTAPRTVAMDTFRWGGRGERR